MGVTNCFENCPCYEENRRKQANKKKFYKKRTEESNYDLKTISERGKNLSPNILTENAVIQTKKPVVKINLKNSKLKEFINQMNYQGLKEETNDTPYNELLRIETDELKKKIDNIREDFESEINKLLNFSNIKIDDLIIDNILGEEFTTSMIQNKISEIAKIYENDKEKYSIDHLRIMLVGRKDIGQKELINYMLELEPNENNNNRRGEFREYNSERVPFIKLVEYKGIGFDKGSEPIKIGKEICEHINKLQMENHNNFIHCIWYCITETKFEKPEIAVLKMLKDSYKNDNELPVITVYTKTESNSIADQMEHHIRNQKIDTTFIKTLAESFEMPNGKIKAAFGREELLAATLEKCTQALQGSLINLMTNNIADEIKQQIFKKNEKIVKQIEENIVDNFINDFTIVKDDGDLINYIINIVIENLKKLNESNISNKSFNLLNRSRFISEINNKIQNYKAKVKQTIKDSVEKMPKIFLDKQASIEIEKGNMEINHKRTLKDFEKATEIFLKKNLYYISQRLMISYIIEIIYFVFFRELEKKLDNKIENILNINNNQYIKQILEHTFLVKLKDFGEKWKIEIKNNKLDDEIVDFPDKKEIEKDEERENNNNLITNSFIYSNEEKKDEEINNQIDKMPIDPGNWFPFDSKKEWKYINDNKISLEKYLQNMEIQDLFFNIETNDQTFANFREYIKNELIIFLSKKYKEFMKTIDKSTKKFPFEKGIIQSIIEKENISSILDEQIANEINLINDNIGQINIDYISILVAGRSGIGKSTLINGMLKEKVAKDCVGFRGTVNNKGIYRGKNNFLFLRMFDTMGTELDEKVSLDKIVKNVNDIIDNMKIEAKKPEHEDFNKNIQCIYYCVKGSSLEEAEIKAIENIKKNKELIPVIVVFTMGINKNDIEKMRNLIKTRLDLPFTSVLVEKMEELDNYGLDDLLKLTLDICQNAKKGKIYKAIKEIICKKVKSNLRKVNENTKKIICNNILKKTMDFKKTLNDEELYQDIYNLIEIAFIEYINLGKNRVMILKEESKEDLRKLKMLNDYIKDFIKFYKKKSKEFVEPILEKYSLDFLDMQVKKEKILSNSICGENKYIRENFKEIIKDFLDDNFYYISQKYLIYKLIYEFSEPFCDELGKTINKIVDKNLETTETNQLTLNSFDIIFNAFRDKIYKNSKNGKIYEQNDNNDKNNEYAVNPKIMEIRGKNLDCPSPAF